MVQFRQTPQSGVEVHLWHVMKYLTWVSTARDEGVTGADPGFLKRGGGDVEVVKWLWGCLSYTYIFVVKGGRKTVCPACSLLDQYNNVDNRIPEIQSHCPFEKFFYQTDKKLKAPYFPRGFDAVGVEVFSFLFLVGVLPLWSCRPRHVTSLPIREIWQ